MDGNIDTELLIGDGSAPKVKKPAKKSAKPKAKKPAAKKAGKVKKKVGRVRAALNRKAKKPTRAIVRTERLDMRLSKAEKSKVSRIAKKLKRTLTSVVYEAIEKLK